MRSPGKVFGWNKGLQDDHNKQFNTTALTDLGQVCDTRVEAKAEATTIANQMGCSKNHLL